MAKRFLMLVLIVSTILCGISYSLPYRRDIELVHCDSPHIPHVVLVNSTNGAIIKCARCYQCQPGHGFGMPCDGQNVSKVDLDFKCVGCVAGVNYSTSDSIQCQPCLSKVCKDGMKIEGKCEPKGDKRTCASCERKNWYYNDTQKVCQPCFCQNMTKEIKQTCSGLGFNHVVECNHSTPLTTTVTPVAKARNVWKTKYTIIVACLVAIILVAYLCCVRKRIKKLKLDHQSLSVFSKDWFCPIFFCKEATRSRPPSYTVEDRQAPNGCTSRAVHYFRQNSCPVTQNEKYMVDQGPEAVKLIQPQPTECKRKNLKFFEMNSEVCRKICQTLKQNVDTGMGYPTLAGHMGFTANNVKSFKENGDPCQNMFECWSNLNKRENTVLKLTELVAKIKRDDILELLKSELLEKRRICSCFECAALC